MNESSFWVYLKGLMKQRWDATRIESDTGAGIPDVSYGVPTGNGWIELKYLPAFPKKSSTPIKMSHFTSQQKMWLKRRGRIAGNVWLLVRVEDEFFLFDWQQALLCEAWNQNEWRFLAKGFWSGRIDPDGLYRILSGGCSNGLGEGKAEVPA